MPGRNQYRNKIELLQGILDLIILQTLQRGQQHSYGLSQAIRTNSGKALQVDTGSLYPALDRQERPQWVNSAWKVSENNQRVKVYRLTTKGKRHQAEERSRWEQLSGALARALNPQGMENEA